MNQTGGLFGGLIIVTCIGAAVVWVSPQARALLVGALGGAPAPSSSAGVPAPNAGSFGTYSSTAPTASTQPYQLTFNPTTGVGISTAATIPVNEAPAIPLPSFAPLAPTSSGLQYA